MSMHQRKSLLDAAGISDTPAAKGSAKAAKMGGGRSKADTIKLSVALGLFVVAAVLIAFYAGLFSGSEPPPPPPTAEEMQALEKRNQDIQVLEQQNKVQRAGSD